MKGSSGCSDGLVVYIKQKKKIYINIYNNIISNEIFAISAILLI